MPAQWLSMRKIKEVLRLRWGNGLSKRKAARSCNISRPAVDEYLRRAEAAGLSWPLPADLDDGALERLLFPSAPRLPAPVRGLPDWISSHQRCFQYLGGVPEIVVPDNLRSGFTKAHRYEPDTNPTYQDMATHYGVVVLPARVRRPRDKAKVEAGVLVVESWILAALRQLLTTLAKTEVLILDDWRLAKLTAEHRRDLLEVLEDRHGTRSTLATSQLPI